MLLVAVKVSTFLAIVVATVGSIAMAMVAGGKFVKGGGRSCA